MDLTDYAARLPGDSEDRASRASTMRAELERRERRAMRPFKTCPRCERELPARGFAADPSRPDNLRRLCRPCDSRRRRMSTHPGT